MMGFDLGHVVTLLLGLLIGSGTQWLAYAKNAPSRSEVDEKIRQSKSEFWAAINRLKEDIADDSHRIEGKLDRLIERGGA